MKGQKLNNDELNAVVGGTAQQMNEMTQYLKDHGFWNDNQGIGNSIQDALCNAYPNFDFESFKYIFNQNSSDVLQLTHWDAAEHKYVTRELSYDEVMGMLKNYYGN